MPCWEALQLAVAVHAVPARNAELWARDLPRGVTEVLRIAGRQEATIEEAWRDTGHSRELLVDAARFFVEQQLLAREFEGNPWRVLGVDIGADEATIQRHRRLLVALVHPDRSDDWAASYSDRVNRAWRALRSPESRQVQISRASAGAMRPADGGPTTEKEAKLGEQTNGDNWPSTPFPNRKFPISDAGSALSISTPPALDRDRRHSSRWRLPMAGFALLAVIGITLFVVSDREWRGEEIIVPLAKEIAPKGSVPVATSESLGERRIETQTYEQHSIESPPAASVAPNDGLASADAKVDLSDPLVSAVASQVENSPLLEKSAVVVRATLDKPVAAVMVRPDRTPSTTRPPENDAHERAPASAAIDFVDDNSTKLEADSVTDDFEFGASRSRLPLTVPSASGKPLSVAADVKSDDEQVDGGRAVSAIVKPEPLRHATSVGSGGLLVPSPVIDGTQRLKLEGADAVVLLDSFSRNYATGDLNGLLSLFSRRANAASGGSTALAADYAKLFIDTRDRSISLSNLSWTIRGQILRGDGSFEASYYRKGKLLRQTVRGRIAFVVVQEDGSARLLRLDSNLGGGGA